MLTGLNKAQPGKGDSMTHQEAADKPKGILVLIGGGDYEQAEFIDRFMLKQAGGADAPVVFLPAAHPSRRTGEKFIEYYRSLGAQNVCVVPVFEREDAYSEENIKLIHDAKLIFFGWGTSGRLTSVLWDTPLLAALNAAYHCGAVMGCMSACCRAAGEVCIVRGTGIEALREGLQKSPLRDDTGSKGQVQLVEGFNWVPGLALESHLSEWNRYGNLFLMAALRPELTWIGIDESTALVVYPDESAEVIGSGNVFVFRRAKPGSVSPPQPGKALKACDLRLDILSHGTTTTLSALRSSA